MTSTPSPRRFSVSGYTWILLAAVVLRGVYLFQALANNELIGHPLVDASVYVEWAKDILGGKWLWYEPMHYTPAIPLWLAGWAALVGWSPETHFGMFHFFGALQAVLLGKTAELIWNRRVGLATGWIAALYWPLIIFEASYYAESFAIWNFTLALFLVIRWWRKGGSYLWLLWAGFHLGWSILARANAMLCLPIIALWIFWKSLSSFPTTRGKAALLASSFVLPVIVLCAPVLFWNFKLTGRPMLRTGGWLSVYLGNDPQGRGLCVPAGVRWNNFVYRPVLANKITDSEQEDYWRTEVFKIIKDRPAEWLQLLGRKTILLTNQFEVSQEIDIPIFRSASPVLAFPVWPGWGFVAPLSLLTAAVMLRRGHEARNGLLLLSCAAVYFLSIAPVQACSRYRLPTVVPLLPLAGWALMFLWEKARTCQWRTIAKASLPVMICGLFIWPDWLGIEDEKIINHPFLIGVKRFEEGNHKGAERAFTAGMKWNPLDPDCPLRIAHIRMTAGDLDAAEPLYHKARENLPGGYEAFLGMGECALLRGKYQEAFGFMRKALAVVPNNMDALNLASRISAAMHDWTGMALICRMMSGYPVHPTSIEFSEAWAWVRGGSPKRALEVYDRIAANPKCKQVDRERASFLGGILAWRLTYRVEQSTRHWNLATPGSGGFFLTLMEVLQDQKSPETLDQLPEEIRQRSKQHIDYTLGLHAWQHGDTQKAREYFLSVTKVRQAADLPLHLQDILEIWAMEDLKVIRETAAPAN